MFSPQKKPFNVQLSLLLIFAVGTLTLSWSGFFDTATDEFLDEALLGSGAIYASARAINAVVSLLQGTEVDALFLTVSIGELLDPINDLIERFSGVMMIALGSLAAQKILLELVSHTFFNIVLTLLGVVAITSYIWGSMRFFSATAKLYLVTLAIRFSLVLAVLITGWVDTEFLQQSESANHQAMQEFHADLVSIRKGVTTSTELSAEIVETKESVATSHAALKYEQNLLKENQQALINAEQHLIRIDKRTLLEKLWRVSTKAIDQAKEKVSELKRKIKSNETSIRAHENRLKALQESLNCLHKKNAGGYCSTIDRIPTKDAMAQRIELLSNQVTDFASNAINLLVSVLVKSLILPLVFFYTFFQLFRLTVRSI